MDSLEKLAIVHEITRLKSTYCRTLDTKDFDGFESLFAEGARVEFRVPSENAVLETFYDSDDMDDFFGIVRSLFEGKQSMHHCHNPEIDVESANEASAIWAMEDKIITFGGVDNDSYRGFGHYFERYVRGPRGWQITSLRLDYLFRIV